MIDIRMRYLAGLFGDISKITPQVEIIKDVLDMFSAYGMLPGTFHEIGPSGNAARLLMSDPVSGLAVHFATNRIDIVQLPTDRKGDNLGDLNVFITKVNNIASLICEKYDLLFNRVSLVAEYILEDMPEEKLTSIKSVCIPKGLNVATIPSTEWNIREVVTSELDVDGTVEKINRIVILARQQLQLAAVDNGENIKLDRIKLELDVNTVADNTNTRFSHIQVAAFMEKAAGVHGNLIENVGNIINV